MSDSKQWWAAIGPRMVQGTSRQDAADQFIAAYPASKYANIMTGYGTFGPQFDVQWIKLVKEEEW